MTQMQQSSVLPRMMWRNAGVFLQPLPAEEEEKEEEEDEEEEKFQEKQAAGTKLQKVQTQLLAFQTQAEGRAQTQEKLWEGPAAWERQRRRLGGKVAVVGRGRTRCVQKGVPSRCGGQADPRRRLQMGQSAVRPLRRLRITKLWGVALTRRDRHRRPPGGDRAASGIAAAEGEAPREVPDAPVDALRARRRHLPGWTRLHRRKRCRNADVVVVLSF
ncbi:heat shock protein beta-8 isoform X16 [Vanacampus margaritifer]